MDTDLSLTDIRFLRTVRDINSNPEEYAKTSGGEVPASTGAIKGGSDLSRSEVEYRMGGKNCRGLQEEGLTVVHEAEFNEETRTFGPKSVELTGDGLEALSEFNQNGPVSGSGSDTDESETVKQLRARIDELEKEVEEGGRSVESDSGIELRSELSSIRSRLNEIEQSEWGGVDESHIDDLNKTVKRLPAMYYILSEVFGLDVDRVTREAPLDESTIAEIRESALKNLDMGTAEESSSQTSGQTNLTPPSSLQDGK